ncbi:MAG: hypothetical protein J6125_01400, partial [Clostridia bacterium]|nr:hypothetical protein [Clostridia bacterium]
MKNLIKVIAVVLLLATMTCLLVACKPSGTFKHEESETVNGETTESISQITFKGNKIIFEEEE